MASKQMKDSGKNKPLYKARAGRFQISIWAFRRLLTNGSPDSTFYLEKQVDVHRACIQYSTLNKATGQWKNQAIWCSVDDLRSLAMVIDKIEDEQISTLFPEDESEVKGFSQASEGKSQVR